MYKQLCAISVHKSIVKAFVNYLTAVQNQGIMFASFFLNKRYSPFIFISAISVFRTDNYYFTNSAFGYGGGGYDFEF